MGKRGPQGVLDEYKKREICAMLTLGASRAAAARFVSCAPNTIKNTAIREPEFARRIARALANCEKECLRNIFHAGPQSWRASAWLLERTRPQKYEKISLRRASSKQLNNFWSESADDLLADLPDEQQALFRDRFQQAAKKFTRSLPTRKVAVDGDLEPCDVGDGDENGVPGSEQREPPAALTPSPGTPGEGRGEGPSQRFRLPCGTCDADGASTPGPARQAGPTALPPELRQVDQEVNRYSSSLTGHVEGVPDLAAMPGFNHPLGEEESDDNEYLRELERMQTVMARNARDNKLAEAIIRQHEQEQAAAGIPPEEREKWVWHPAGSPATLSLLLWLALCVQAMCVQNLARLPSDVPAGALKVSLVPTLCVGTQPSTLCVAASQTRRRSASANYIVPATSASRINKATIFFKAGAPDDTPRTHQERTGRLRLANLPARWAGRDRGVGRAGGVVRSTG